MLFDTSYLQFLHSPEKEQLQFLPEHEVPQFLFVEPPIQYSSTDTTIPLATVPYNSPLPTPEPAQPHAQPPQQTYGTSSPLPQPHALIPLDPPSPSSLFAFLTNHPYDNEPPPQRRPNRANSFLRGVHRLIRARHAREDWDAFRAQCVCSVARPCLRQYMVPNFSNFFCSYPINSPFSISFLYRSFVNFRAGSSLSCWLG
jgi:hypothetical protein